jgi:hypothetical protein
VQVLLPQSLLLLLLPPPPPRQAARLARSRLLRPFFYRPVRFATRTAANRFAQTFRLPAGGCCCAQPRSQRRLRYAHRATALDTT